MGFADMLLKLRIPYNSDESIAVAEEVMALIQEESKASSSALADRRGNFPCYKGSRYDDDCGLGSMRNATTTTIAPTGTISIIASCSSGIEPLFAVCYKRKVLEGTELVEINPHFEELAKRRGFYSASLRAGSPRWAPSVTSRRSRRTWGGSSSPPTRSLRSGTSASRPRSRNTPTTRSPDRQLLSPGSRRRREGSVPQGLRVGPQGCDHLPGRQPGSAGSELRQRQAQVAVYRSPAGAHYRDYGVHQNRPAAAPWIKKVAAQCVTGAASLAVRSVSNPQKLGEKDPAGEAYVPRTGTVAF
jgi:hypothetical protein